MKKFSIFFIFIICFLLLACSSSISGIYEGTQYGIPISMEFRDDTVQTNILGFPISGTYEINRDRITINLTVSMFGMNQSESISGKIDGKNIVFADITLTKIK